MNPLQPDQSPLDRDDSFSDTGAPRSAADADSGPIELSFDDQLPGVDRDRDGADDSPGWIGATDPDSEVPRRRAVFPGPGILESVVWAAGFMFTQVLASLVLGAMVAFAFFLSGGRVDLAEVIRQQQAQEAGQSQREQPALSPADAVRPELPTVADATPPTIPPAAPEETAPGAASEDAVAGGSEPGTDEASGTGATPTPADLPGMRELSRFVGKRMALLLWGAGLATALYAAVVCRFRLGKSGVFQMGWHVPSWQHLLAIGLLVLPLSLFASTIQQVGFTWFPTSKASMEELFEQMRPLPLPMIWLIIAFAPAVSEELLFRGVIGRGLLARYGMIPGILITSVMFGLMHLNPAQIMGTIPIGIAIHFVYRVTRSFWAPMLLHFLNNAFAGLMLKFSDHPAMEQLGDEHGGGQNLLSLVLAVACIAWLCSWLWQTRREFVDSDNVAWDPARAHCGAPPPGGSYWLTSAPPLRWGLLVGSLVLLGGMLVSMVVPPGGKQPTAPKAGNGQAQVRFSAVR